MKHRRNCWDYSSADFRREAGEDLRSLWESVSTGVMALLAGAFSLFPVIVEAGLGVALGALLGMLIPGGGGR